jgi:hypothetical protein
METVIHQVGSLGDVERSAAEQLVGHPLSENQRLVIHVVNVEPGSYDFPDGIFPGGIADQKLPEWCDVYAGMSDEEVAALDAAISQRLDLTRNTL